MRLSCTVFETFVESRRDPELSCVFSCFSRTLTYDRHGQTLMMQYDSYVSDLADRDRDLTHMQLEGKYSLESTDPRESEIRAPPQLTIALKLSYYLFIFAKLFKVKDGCLKFVYNIKIPGLWQRHRKTLTYLRRAYVSVYRYSLEVFPVSRNLYR